MRFVDKDGVRGTISAAPDDAGANVHVTVTLEDGRQVTLPKSLLVERDAENYYLPHSLSAFEAFLQHQDQIVIPVVEERLTVDKQVVESGKVRVSKRVRAEDVLVDEPLMRELIEVERIPVNQLVDAPVSVRMDGDTIVVPLYEEVLVVEKRLYLREEVRLIRRQGETHMPQTVTLRSEEVHIQHTQDTVETQQ